MEEGEDWGRWKVGKDGGGDDWGRRSKVGKDGGGGDWAGRWKVGKDGGDGDWGRRKENKDAGGVVFGKDEEGREGLRRVVIVGGGREVGKDGG